MVLARCASPHGPLKYYFLFFFIFCMLNVYNITLNSYIMTSLRSKKMNQQLFFLFFMSNVYITSFNNYIMTSLKNK